MAVAVCLRPVVFLCSVAGRLIMLCATGIRVAMLVLSRMLVLLVICLVSIMIGMFRVVDMCVIFVGAPFRRARVLMDFLLASMRLVLWMRVLRLASLVISLTLGWAAVL